MKPLFFATQKDFRKYLEKYHKKEKELLVGYYKLASGKASMTWSQSVDQALCFGWIDSVRRTINEESYCIRFTPRKSKSIWSSINIKKVEALIKSKQMKPEGLKAFASRKEHQSGIYSHENEPAKLNPDFEKQFKKNKVAWDFFNQQAPSYIKVTKHWIMGAKQEKTRLNRLEKTIRFSEAQKRMF